MGISASLFYSSNDTEKSTLHRRITPSDEQYEQQKRRWHDLAEFLKSSVEDNSGVTVKWWLQGSYKFETQVRPVKKGEEFDIDLGLYLCWEGGADEGPHGAAEQKALVQYFLLEFARENDDVKDVLVPPKERCCRIIYKDDFHIDVPSYHLDETRDARALATETNGWERSDPKALYLWYINHLSDEYLRAKARRIIRYLKAWAALNFEEEIRPSSTLLTVLVCEAITDVHSGELSSDDDALAAVVTAVVERLEDDSAVENPVDSNETLSDRLADPQGFLARLRAFRDTADRALTADTAIEAAEVWAELFHHMMPLPEPTLTEGASNLPAVTFVPEVRVDAHSRRNRAVTWQDMNKIGPITKDCDIRFSLVNHAAMPAGSSVFWTVRNEGGEAEDKNDLGHLVGEGLGADETSAYKGTHHMDCVVKRFGKIVGYRRIPVTIMAHSTPLRNPPRPSYTALNKKRR